MADRWKLILLCFVLSLFDEGDSTLNGDRKKRDVTLCGEIVSETQGVIGPPTADEYYLPNRFCRWEVRAEEGHRLLLSARTFAMEFSTGCHWDYLEVRDGGDDHAHRVGKYCGYSPLVLLSASDTVFLYFSADGSTQDRGFQLDFRSIPAANSELSQCNQLIETEGLISSPNYPEEYGPYSYCVYWIKAPSDHARIHLEIRDVSLEDSGCLFDYVKIYDGRDSHSPALLDICGDSTHTSYVTSSGNQALVTFVSDGYLEDRGFQIDISFIENDSEEETESQEECQQVIDESMEGVVTSPGFPGLYPNQARCELILRSPEPDHHIRLTLVYLDMEGSINCTFDSLEFFDRTTEEVNSLGKICGQTTQNLIYVTKSDTLKIVLTSDYLVTGRGFLGDYTVLPNEVSNCMPRCNEKSVCVEEKEAFRCMAGKRCEYNICENGECVQQEGNLTCHCTSSFTGMLCDIKIQPPNNVELQPGPLDIHTDQSANRGERVILDCTTNVSDTFFTWALNDRLIMGDAGVIEHVNGSLEILSFGDAYVGMYKCLTDSFDTFSQTTFNLTLKEGCNFEIELSPSDVSAINGDSATLSCTSGQHNMTWLKDGQELREDEEYELSENGTVLTILAVTETTTGEYTCLLTRGDNCEVSRTVQVANLPPRIDNGYCGRPAVPDMIPRMLGRISRGQSVQQGSSPWHVILRDRREMTTFCGGTLISKSWILTAAHCTSNDHFSREFNKSFDANYVDLFLGTDLCNGTGGERRGIRRYIPHPRFGERAPYDNDIALIELDTPVEYNRQIRPICLQSLEAIEGVFMNRRLGRTVGRVIGCGRVHERITETPPYVRDVFVPYVDRRFCSHARIGSGNFTDSMICAGYNRAYFGDACSGDSGGSMSMQRTADDPWFLVGIVSWGVGCDRPGHYGYYTHVAKFLDWVSRITDSEFLETF
ncbi:CUB and sushi domain-containing protein 2-like [Pecten maximus]|uniref:CUB and sushi domain-containing protein 2-like n=1 Tax=Pecten maximus TaxID=6579 RepID=UPI00145896BE|nr:CUB and sushi domain-containing protein 2-like [Pecten maximus]